MEMAGAERAPGWRRGESSTTTATTTANMDDTGSASGRTRRPPPPPYPPMSAAMRNLALTSTRGPFLAACFFKFVALPRFYEPLARRILAWLSSWERPAQALLPAWLWDPHMLAFGLMLPVAHASSYLAVVSFFEAVERLGLLRQYKIGRSPAQIPSEKMKREAFLQTATAWFTMSFGGCLLYRALVWRGADARMFMLPGERGEFSSLFSLSRAFWDHAVGIVASNVSFYVIHRILHTKGIYEKVHKHHHLFVGTVAVGAQALSDPEQIVQTFPVILGALLVGTHPLVWLNFLTWRVFNGLEGHSGYAFRGSWLHRVGLTHADDCVFHDFHHTQNDGNYGVFYMDWLGGTMDHWLRIGEDEGYLAKAHQLEAKGKQVGKEYLE